MGQVQRLKGQATLVKGANPGIGQAIAVEMAKEGARVASLPNTN